MSQSRNELWQQLLDRALTEEMGLVVGTLNPKRATAILHDITKGNERYANLEIVVPSTPNTIMIVKKSVQLDDLTEGNLPDE